MTLVTQTPLLALATPRDLEALAISQKAIQALPLTQRKRALRAATGELITPIRKRYGTPVVPTLDLATVDASGMTGAPTVAWSGGPATLCEDYLLVFPSPTTYTITTSAGAYGATASAAASWAGALTLDGYTLTITGTIHAADSITWSTSVVQDPGIALQVARVAAFILLGNRGTDPITGVSLLDLYKAAITWAAALGIPGEGELDPSLDTTTTAGGKYGPIGAGQNGAADWLDLP